MSKKQHLSRLAAPKTWQIKRKGIKWVAKTNPGPHNLHTSVPMVLMLRDILDLIKNVKEAKSILHERKIKVNGIIQKDHKIGVGLFDLIAIDKIGNFRVVMTKKGKISAVKVDDKEVLLPLKVANKVMVKNKLQVNFANGWNLLLDNKDYKTGDVLLYNTTSKKVDKHLKLDKGMLVYVSAGKHASKVATLEDIRIIGAMRKKKIAILKTKDEEFKTALSYVVPLGEKKVEIQVDNGGK